MSKVRIFRYLLLYLMHTFSDHKKLCPFKDCTCDPCRLTSTRRVVMASQVQFRRTQEKLDKEDKLSSEEGVKKLCDIAQRGIRSEGKVAHCLQSLGLSSPLH